MRLTTQHPELRPRRSAGIPRGQIDLADHKTYISSVLFLKRLTGCFGQEGGNAPLSSLPCCVAPLAMDEREFLVPESAELTRRRSGR